MSNKKKNIYDRVPRGKAILSYYRLWVDGKAELHQRLHLGSEGNKLFYKEYHVTAADAVNYLASLDDFKELIY